NENNNASNAVAITVQAPLRPDLGIYSGGGGLSASNTVVAAGGSTTLSYYVVNNGKAAAGGSTTGLYLSTDATITTGDTLLTTRTTPGLTVNNGGTGWYDLENVLVTLPGNLTAGTYYVGAIADYNNAVGESNESNNASNAVAITVQGAGSQLKFNVQYDAT